MIYLKEDFAILSLNPDLSSYLKDASYRLSSTNPEEIRTGPQKHNSSTNYMNYAV